MTLDDQTGANVWIGFIAMCFAMFMAILDIQVVASSLTVIGEALGVDSDQLSWIQTAYLMAEVISIPLTGWLTRALSLRWMFVLATAGFTLASLGCALSGTVEMLIGIRIVQGLCGGMLIPAVFTSVFTLLPERHRVLATTLAGVFAVLAPTLGPMVGGFLTQTFSWHWIFLVNIFPGIVVCVLVSRSVRKDPAEIGALKHVDYAGIALTSVFLASLELLLQEAPKQDWNGNLVFIVAPLCLAAAGFAVWRMLTATRPFVDIGRFRRMSFSIGSALSFTLGVGLYGSVYMLALFLGLVRGYEPLDIGFVMLVSGAAQLITAPVASVLETRVAPRILVAFGFSLFAAGLFANGFTNVRSDFDALFWPQVMRGTAMMFCLLPATRIALDIWPEKEVPEASAQFNLMRNLGGAIGIAVIDTILFRHAPHYAAALMTRLQAGDVEAARTIGLPVDLFLKQLGPITDAQRAFVEPLIQKAALAQAFTDAWRTTAVIMAASLLLLPFVRKPVPRAKNSSGLISS